MCGIYLTNIPFVKEEVKTKIESIEFRGPDYTGIERVDDLTFGHLRLSIIDLEERSNQPMQFEELTIIFNGEIYNFKDIRDELVNLGHSFQTTGDTEVLLKGFKQWGQSIVPKLNGMFAFAIYNSETKKIFCSRDRLGVKPFYYSWIDGKFEICSQLRPISQNRQINEDAISMYLDCTYIPSPYTIYKDVHKLPPGTNLKIDLKKITISQEKFWDLEKVKIADLTYSEAKNKLHELLKDAVKIRLKSDVPFGSFLSGGIDSALVSALASKVSKDTIKTFTIGFENPQYDESKVAAEFAKIIRSNHTETICKPEDFLKLIPQLLYVYDEPFADSSALPSLLLNKVTKDYVTVALSGDGGDESFLGYNHFELIQKLNRAIQIPYFFRKHVVKILNGKILGKRTSEVRNILTTKSKDELIAGIFTGFNSLLKKRNLNWLAHYQGYKHWSENILQQTADLNIKLWLENDSNVKVDRASMASSVEVRSPFLDYRVIEFARTLPINYRYIPGRRKRILRDILKEYIPEEVFTQPKKGFSVPIGSWIRKELKKEFDDNLSDNNLSQIPNFNIKKFKKMYKDHQDGIRDYSSYIWRVYILSRWIREFGSIDKS